jgi:tetrahydromethanopterin S-methyltransferase subunit E
MREKRIARQARSGAAWLAAIAVLAGLAMYPQAVFGGTRKAGAAVIVKTETGDVKGELISVREDAVVVMSEQGSDAIPLSDIETVTIVKPAPTLAFALLGGLVGGAIGAATAPHTEEVYTSAPAGSGNSTWDGFGDAISQGLGDYFNGIGHVFICSSAGALAGWLGAKVAHKNKVIAFKSGSETDTAAALESLKKEARVPDYK